MTPSSSLAKTTGPHVVLRRAPSTSKLLPQVMSSFVRLNTGWVPRLSSASKSLQVISSKFVAGQRVYRPCLHRQLVACSGSGAAAPGGNEVALLFQQASPIPSSTCDSEMPLRLQPINSQKPEDPVEAALKKVNEAVNTAEKQLDKLDKLPSARMPRQVCLHAAFFTPILAAKPTPQLAMHVSFVACLG